MFIRNILLTLLLVLVGCENSYSLPIEFTIINSSDVWGETEPCGWPKNPLGGLLEKLALLMKKH